MDRIHFFFIHSFMCLTNMSWHLLCARWCPASSSPIFLKLSGWRLLSSPLPDKFLLCEGAQECPSYSRKPYPFWRIDSMVSQQFVKIGFFFHPVWDGWEYDWISNLGRRENIRHLTVVRCLFKEERLHHTRCVWIVSQSGARRIGTKWLSLLPSFLLLRKGSPSTPWPTSQGK